MELANFTIWRSVTLGKGPRTHLSREAIKNLLAQGENQQQVREITVQNLEGEEFSVEELGQIIRQLNHLDSFSWNAAGFIPNEILTTLLECWPDSRLHASPPRGDRNPVIDISLLSSPLLHSLILHISWESAGYFYTEKENDKLSSELNIINEILSKSPKLEILDLRLGRRNFMRESPPSTIHSSRTVLKLPDDAIFPNIRSLTIPTHQEGITKSPRSTTTLTSILLNQCLNWTTIQTLHLWGLCPQYTMSELRGRVPNLDSLDIAFPVESGMTGFLAKELVKEFIMSLEQLRELKIWNMWRSQADVVWPAIIKHRGTLESLTLYTSMCGGISIWTLERLKELLDTKISHLGIHIPLEDITAWFLNPITLESTSPEAVLSSLTSTLTRFTNLSSLTIYVDITTEANLLAAEYVNFNSAYGNGKLPPLDFSKAEDIAIRLFKQTLLHNQKSELQKVEIRILRLYYEDRGQCRPLGTGVIVNRVNEDRGDVEFEVVIDQENWWSQ